MDTASYRFRNWARTHSCQVAACHQPRDEEEIVELVRSARRRGVRLKAVGGGHSWSDIALTDGELVRLDGYDRVLAVDRERHQVTVQAGIRLRQLNELLPEHGLGLSNLGSIAEQSIAGATATATHGTGIRFGNLATQVVALRLVTGAGEVRELSADCDPELYSAARVSLGALGIVSTVTLQCEPAFHLEERTFSLPFERALAEMDTLVDQHEHVKLWWLPHTDRVQVFTWNRTDAPLRRRAARHWLDQSLATRSLFAGLLRLSKLIPGVTPSVNSIVNATYFRPRQRVDRSDRVFSTIMPPIHREAEYGIPRAQAAVALERLRKLIEQHRLHVNFIVELRFVAADDILMSPCYGRPSCQFGAYMYPNRSIETYFHEFERLMADLDGRPHWGKEFTLDAQSLRRQCPGYDRFDAIRRQLDPHGIFENDFVRRVFAAAAMPATAQAAGG
jgi:FAD-linked oxidoreductase